MKIHRDYPDWRDYGVKASLPLNPDWQHFSFTFRAHSAEDQGTVRSLSSWRENRAIEIDRVSLRPGTVAFTLPWSQSLRPSEYRPGRRCRNGTATRRLDPVPRLDAGPAFSEGMRAYLTEDLGFHNLIIDSQIEWGGLTSFAREARPRGSTRQPRLLATPPFHRPELGSGKLGFRTHATGKLHGR